MASDRLRLLRLDAAATAYFGPESGITGRTLGRQGRDGKLTTYLISNRLFTTFADIDIMVARSTVERPPPHPPSPNPESQAGDARIRAKAAIAQLRERS